MKTIDVPFLSMDADVEIAFHDQFHIHGNLIPKMFLSKLVSLTPDLIGLYGLLWSFASTMPGIDYLNFSFVTRVDLLPLVGVLCRPLSKTFLSRGDESQSANNLPITSLHRRIIRPFARSVVSHRLP